MPVSVAVTEGPLRPFLDRLLATVVLALVLALVGALLRVEPDPRGYATHEALGMQPCGWPRLYGKPCPTCGVTTAASWLVHLAPLRALSTQPFGAIAMAALLGLGAWALVALVRGRSFVLPLTLLPTGRVVIGTVLVFLLGWLWKYETFVV